MDHLSRVRLLPLLVLACVARGAEAEDWARFRGAGGASRSSEAAPPTTWGPGENLAWSAELPGPGSSSPIVVGDRVFVTCYAGYGEDPNAPGDPADLVRMLLGFDRATGAELWRDEVPAERTPDPYEGFITQHGYASHTPVSDGERVYAYYGKSGLYAYDLAGERLWSFDCGGGSGGSGWGSAASPIVVGDLVIAAATAESEALIALDKRTGEEVWRHTESGWKSSWSTPILAEVEGRTELIYSAPLLVVAFDPATGEELWRCVGADSETITASPVVQDGVVYTVSSRGGAVAVRTGGAGELDESQIVWRGGPKGGITSPVIDGDRLYSLSRGMLIAADLATGERVYRERLAAPLSGKTGFGNGAYSSPVVAGGLLYHFSRDGTGHVVRLGGEFEEIAVNPPLAEGDYSATPALSDGEMFVRSGKRLFCVRAMEE